MSRKSPHTALCGSLLGAPGQIQWLHPPAFPAPSSPCGIWLTRPNQGAGITRGALSTLKAHPDLWNQNSWGRGECFLDMRVSREDLTMTGAWGNSGPRGPQKLLTPTTPNVLGFTSSSPTFPADLSSVHIHTNWGGKKH